MAGNNVCEESKMATKRKSDGAGDEIERKMPCVPVFQGFNVTKVINDDSQKKLIILHGTFESDEAKRDAVVILEKKAFSATSAAQILCKQTDSELILQNDIYGTHELHPPAHLNGIKSTLIYPATENHIAKYTQQEMFILQERAEDYQNVTLPYIEATQFSIKWVYNILDKKTESERIVFEDTDKEKGFVLLPDMKWDGKQVEDLYLVAIVHQHGIKSLRDLTTQHLPLLRNILHNGTKAIGEKYGVPATQLRTYIHYQPSYYHLHVHFTHLRHDAPGCRVERAHLLSDVIQSIEMCPLYYQKATLSFTTRITDKLYLAFKEADRV